VQPKSHLVPPTIPTPHSHQLIPTGHPKSASTATATPADAIDVDDVDVVDVEMVGAPQEGGRHTMYNGWEMQELATDCPEVWDRINPDWRQSLQPGGWLTSRIIHRFFQLLCDTHLAGAASRQKILFFESFFMTKLLNLGHNNPEIHGAYDFEQVWKWHRKRKQQDIFGVDKLLIPINHDGNHWVCAVVSMKDKTIDILDSLGWPGVEYQTALLRFLEDKHLSKKGVVPLPDKDSWRFIPPQATTPRQKNGNDCGVFVCMFAAAHFFSDELANNPTSVWDVCPGELAFRDLISRAVIAGRMEDPWLLQKTQLVDPSQEAYPPAPGNLEAEVNTPTVTLQKTVTAVNGFYSIAQLRELMEAGVGAIVLNPGRGLGNRHSLNSPFKEFLSRHPLFLQRYVLAHNNSPASQKLLKIACDTIVCDFTRLHPGGLTLYNYSKDYSKAGDRFSLNMDSSTRDQSDNIPVTHPQIYWWIPRILYPALPQTCLYLHLGRWCVDLHSQLPN
jgi:Ulp1 protease family, C-terminal catalytic domain